MTNKLTLDKKNKKIAGVCAGFAKMLDADATILRIVFVLLTFLGFSGILFYLICWALIPNEEKS